MNTSDINSAYKPKLVVFGYYGTCALETPEGNEAFSKRFINEFAERVGITFGITEAIFAEKRALIEREPQKFGVEKNGSITAASTTNEMTLSVTCAQMILKDLDRMDRQWEECLESIRVACLPEYRLILSPHFVETVTKLHSEGISTCVISDDDPNEAARFFDYSARPTVFGHGKRMHLTKKEPDILPEWIDLHGLKRRIPLKKGHYYTILDLIRAKYQLNWDDMLIVGNSVELDLLIPVIMGACGCYISGINAPVHEIIWAREHPSVRTITSFPELL